MKLLRRVFCLAAALMLVCSTLIAAQAAGGEPYTYTVRLYAGQQGTIVSGVGDVSPKGDVLVCSNLAYGSQFNFYNNMVTLKDGSKYYVKGIRQSGKGTEEITESGVGGLSPSFTVTKDQDYVVAYGVLTNPVAYVINYLDEDGNALLPSETYYGNVGDKPVVAYQYVENFQPRAYNLAKTLSENEEENVFNFVYVPVPEGTVNTEVVVIEEEGPGAVVVPPEEPVTPAAPGGEEAPTEPATPPAGEENVPDAEVPNAAPDTPLDEWDLDNGEVPLANAPDSITANGEQALSGNGQMLWDKIPLPVKILGSVVLLGGVGFATWFLLVRRKRKEEQ